MSGNSILDQLVLNISTNRVFIFIVNLTTYINNVSKFFECISAIEKIQTNNYHTRSLRDQYVMSHSHNMASFVVALDCRVGIDIELHNDNLDVQELEGLVLTPAESKYLFKLNTKEKLQLFYHLWTEKWSLIKTHGQGLSYSINTIEVVTLSSGNNILLTNGNNALPQNITTMN